VSAASKVAYITSVPMLLPPSVVQLSAPEPLAVMVLCALLLKSLSGWWDGAANPHVGGGAVSVATRQAGAQAST
jgi:hypothetical protein